MAPPSFAVVAAVAASMVAAAPVAGPVAEAAPQMVVQGSMGMSYPTASVGTSEYSSRKSSAASMMASATSAAQASWLYPTATYTGPFGPDSQVPASHVSMMSAPPVRSSQVTGKTSHGSFTGSATTTGAPQSGPLASSIAPKGPAATATYYNANGKLTKPEPAPYIPAGGLGTDGTLPRYMVESDFDFESIALGLYQEWIELDLFHNGVAVFSKADFAAAGLSPEDISYIEFMADQEAGHATLLSNMLGQAAPPQCTYDYPYKTVREFVDFAARLTRWGESGVWGFINHLDSREVGQLLAQSIATEARQEYTFRQYSGLKPMQVWFEAGIPQSWAWTYLAPYISSCPANTTRLAWQNFPQLTIVNNPNINRVSPNDTTNYETVGRRIADPSNSTLPPKDNCLDVPIGETGYSCRPAIAHNRSEPLSFAGKQIFLEWESKGKPVGPNMSYVTDTAAGAPKYVGWVNQLNMTYTDLVVTGPNKGYTFQPDAEVYQGDPLVNQTMFVFLADKNIPATPFNLSNINPNVAALGLYVAG